MSESLEDWIVREARAISGPRTHLQDSEALIQFGLRVARRAALHGSEAGPQEAREEAITTYTPLLWASMTDDQRWAEYVRVRSALCSDLGVSPAAEQEQPESDGS